MAYQVKTTKSYGSRLGESAKGIFTGFIMFIIGTVLLFWNEGNFVKTKKAINEVKKETVIVSDVSTIDPALSGKPIHATAFANTEDILTDDMFGVSENAISINRQVEYYQYVEHSKSETRDKIGGGEETITTYSYEIEWVKEPVNSSNFADPEYRSANKVLRVVEPKTQYAQNVSFGGYKLPTFFISQISGSVPAEVNIEPEEMMHVSDNVVYFGESFSNPQIGDVRVTLTKILPAEISIIGKVTGSTFEKYIAKNGKEFARLAMGQKSAHNMFEEAHAENSMITWLLRIIGIIVIVMGLKSMLKIIPTLLKVLPFLGNIVEAGLGLVCAIGGGAWSLLIIALAWLFYRPLIGIPMLAAAIAGIWYLKKVGKEKKLAAAQLAQQETVDE
ncbi:MAG: TMEM43 family protein [Marinilabiliaceae bacterium]|nr:TMEM43 family protein [Marinilabiliaceae bacterium]